MNNMTTAEMTTAETALVNTLESFGFKFTLTEKGKHPAKDKERRLLQFTKRVGQGKKLEFTLVTGDKGLSVYVKLPDDSTHRIGTSLKPKGDINLARVVDMIVDFTAQKVYLAMAAAV